LRSRVASLKGQVSRAQFNTLRNKSRLAPKGLGVCTICPFFAKFSTFTKIPQVPSFQAHSSVKTVFRQNPKNARKSQNTPSTNPYQNETQFPLSSLKNATSGHARPPKRALYPPVISGTNSRQNSGLPKPPLPKRDAISLKFP
jgi:hypothetical protein